MAVNNNTIKTRIRLKSDIEDNWKKAGPKDGSAGFVPLQGELIVYNPDTTHPFSRLKIGDGSTNVVNLPFVDAGTLNGDETVFVKKENFNAFPSPGSENQLYIDLSTNRIYHYAPASGYSQLANFSINLSTTTVGSVMGFDSGKMTEAMVSNNILTINNGSKPVLSWMNKTVVNDVTKE